MNEAQVGEYTLSAYEKASVVCRGCGQADQLYKDAHGIFCHRCGPSVPMAERTVFQRVSAHTHGDITVASRWFAGDDE
jgi:hypothetical protein